MFSNLFPFGFGAFAPTVGIGFFVHSRQRGKGTKDKEFGRFFTECPYFKSGKAAVKETSK
jgi:hypothetical protein